MQGVDAREVDVGEWLRTEKCHCDQPETGSEGVQGRSIHARAVKLGFLRERDSLQSWIEKL